MTAPLERAKELLDGLEQRHQAKLAEGEINDLNTELNELRRILVYLIEHAEGSERAD